MLTGLTKNEVSWRISDHCRLWVQFGAQRSHL